MKIATKALGWMGIVAAIAYGYSWLGAYVAARQDCPRGAVVRDALTQWPMCADGRQ